MISACFTEVVIVRCSYSIPVPQLLIYVPSFTKASECDSSVMFMISSSLHQLKCSGFSIYQLLVDLSVICTTVLLGRLVGHLNAV
jgi:hypothetical protein